MTQGPMDDLEIARSLRLDARPGPAPRISSKRAAAMLDAALDAWSPPAVVQPPSAPPADARARTTALPRLRWGLVAAAAVFVLLAVAAAYWIGRRQGASGAPERSPASRASRAPTRPLPGAMDTTPRTMDTAPRATDTIPAVGGADSAPRIAAPSARRTPSPARREQQQTDPAESAEDQLREANRLRGARRWRDAERTYGRVAREHPGTLSAHVARIAQAGIRLEHLGDAAGALRLYRGALGGRSGGGALAIEARQGVAESYRRLGNTAQEVRALREIQRAHPGSAAARRAARRLESLEASSP